MPVEAPVMNKVFPMRPPAGMNGGNTLADSSRRPGVPGKPAKRQRVSATKGSPDTTRRTT